MMRGPGKDESARVGAGASGVSGPMLAIAAGRRTVEITRPSKELFPGITKEDVARYYAAVAPFMLPHVRGRALTMERYPDGIDGPMIYMKNAAKYFPGWIKTAPLPKKGGTVTHVVAGDAATLVYLAGQASIAMHVTLSRVDKPSYPDLVVFDLDPSGPDFGSVRRTALAIRAACEADGLVPFVKTTGSKGLHVVCPVRRAATFEDTHAYARRVAERLVEESPDELTFEFSKAKRGGRIYMDVDRNGFGATYAAPYSLRPRPGAPVSMPVTWDEVASASLRPDGFSLSQALKRLESTGDLWAGLRAAARTLPRQPR